MSTSTIPSVAIHSHRSPNSFFTPTHMDFRDVATAAPQATWQSRRARKGRYAPKVARVHTHPDHEPKEVEARVKHVESEFKPGLRADISFWVAIAFTFGSAVWVVNGQSSLHDSVLSVALLDGKLRLSGYIVWFPVIRPDLASTTFYNTAAALAFIGGTVFEIGSYLGVVEALDRWVSVFGCLYWSQYVF